jgi:hypothetical protein
MDTRITQSPEYNFAMTEFAENKLFDHFLLDPISFDVRGYITGHFTKRRYRRAYTNPSDFIIHGDE